MSNTIKNILNKTHKIFLERGFRNVSMEDICRELGISKKTIYHYVNNKQELIQKVLQNEKQKIFDKIFTLKNQKFNAIDILLEVSKITIEKHFRFNPQHSFELKKYYPGIFQEFLQEKQVIITNFIKDNLEQGIKEDLYRQEIDTDIVSKLYYERLMVIYNPQNFDENNFSFEKFFEVMFENHIRGIANEKGIKYFEDQKNKYKFNLNNLIS